MKPGDLDFTYSKPYAPCIVDLPTFGSFRGFNFGKYSSSMEHISDIPADILSSIPIISLSDGILRYSKANPMGLVP